MATKPIFWFWLDALTNALVATNLKKQKDDPYLHSEHEMLFFKIFLKF